MQVVAVVIDTWAAPSEANSSSSSSDALRLRALLLYLLHAACKCRGNDAWRLSVSPGNMQHCDWLAHTALIKFAWPKPIGRAPLKGSFQCACTRARERKREHQGFAQQIVGALWQASSVKLQLFHCPLCDYFAPVVWLAACLCMCACVCLWLKLSARWKWLGNRCSFKWWWFYLYFYIHSQVRLRTNCIGM